MYNPFGYEACTSRLDRLLSHDRFSGANAPAWRRLWRMREVRGLAETNLAWFDPLFTEARARYLEVLYQVRPRSRRFRALVASGIGNACETHGHDGPVTNQLRAIRALAWEKAGKALDDKVRRAEEELARATGRQYVGTALRLAGLYERAGQYDAMIATYGTLAAAHTRLGVAEREAQGLDAFVAALYYSHGEVVRATRLLERSYARQSEHDLLDDLGVRLQLAECYVHTGQPRAAESVLRNSLDRLSRHEDRWHHPEVHQLRHQTLYELGKALWHQRRAPESSEFFSDAFDLVLDDPPYLRKYRNAYTLSLLD
jgi:tetratricopeptide (TPR) repeat protein